MSPGHSPPRPPRPGPTSHIDLYVINATHLDLSLLSPTVWIQNTSMMSKQVTSSPPALDGRTRSRMKPGTIIRTGKPMLNLQRFAVNRHRRSMRVMRSTVRARPRTTYPSPSKMIFTASPPCGYTYLLPPRRRPPVPRPRGHSVSMSHRPRSSTHQGNPHCTSPRSRNPCWSAFLLAVAPCPWIRRGSPAFLRQGLRQPGVGTVWMR